MFNNSGIIQFEKDKISEEEAFEIAIMLEQKIA
jgi:transcriptional/translational regulatory protein YebC/TACO1